MPAKNTEQGKNLNKTTGKNTRKKTTPQKVPNLNPSPAEREENIRTSAYFRWEQRGEIHGFDVEDWLHAEKTVNS